jgi:hypothetical protein
MANLKLKENLDIKSTGVSTSGQNAIPKSGDIIPFAGTSAPIGWVMCDGLNGTPDLRGRFATGANAAGNIGTAFGNSTHSHTYSTNSYNVGTATDSHDGVDVGGITGGNSASHGHSVGTTFGSGSGANNLIANSTTSGGPIQFVAKPHSHNGSGSVNFNAAGVGTHNHGGFGFLNANRSHAHNTGHSITAVPSGNAAAGSSLVPFIIMNYIMKV